MKFSHSLQFNAVPEWTSKYIAYTTLKKLIYSLQRENLRQQLKDRRTDDEDMEAAHLISNEYSSISQGSSSGASTSMVFLAALDAELKKIDEFYQTQEAYVYQTMDDLIIDIENFEKELGGSSYLSGRKDSEINLFTLDANETSHSAGGYVSNTTDFDTQAEDFDNDDDDEEEPYHGEPGAEYDQAARGRSKSLELANSKSIDTYLKSPKSPRLWNSLNNASDGNTLPPQLVLLSENRVILRKRVIGLFTTLSELKSYIELNQTGFKKALKKFDKSLNTNLKDDYLNKLPLETYIFREGTMATLKDHIDSLIKLYALICNHGQDLETAKAELSIHLREHVVWERNTVWRDMIGLERKTYAANSKLMSGGDRLSGDKGDRKSGDGKLKSTFNLSLRNPAILKLILIFTVTLLLLLFSPFEDEAQNHCFALVICASLLWATETIPLFVTSLLIPLLIVVLGVVKNPDGTLMNAEDSSKFILSTMWNSVILLLLGGFTLAAALSKYHIAKLISTWILSKAGTNPLVVLLTVMSVALFASMWVSNVAAPVLCFSIIQPLLRTLPKGSRFINALILGIALASNIGGMASPIALPQNMIAIGAMDPQPSWGQWFVIAIPVCILLLVLIWGFLLLTFNTLNTQLVAIRTIDDKFSGIQWYIVGVSGGTIFLWCIASRLLGIFGEMGIIALIPVILFFGPGLLTTEDFNNYPWNIVVLAMGGTALGKAVALLGLLATIATTIQEQVEDFSLFGVTLTFGLLILIMATFVSHTVAALIIIPLVAEIGNHMPDPHPRLLIMASALLCSAAMGLPTSGFPNVTAICMTDEFGKPYLTVGTFITRGVPSSIIAYAIIVSVGYATMRLINF
ncbi:low-affinity phosphate transporter [Suhomyces tanzawaensis NRRL Y-17324]|uniref:Low-affinity phosphate transporter n=1 Tax=Suhomyces tanzawaensis NRRL Y-17324 TaxID=984487 RepID=A0A1E4SI47_9ASCO|nr:low-affinity phosphate transporter [Suhomyces tanzawaensis NRRL Y-17324]ODV79102.1 low-affinity phosphate transporter [Suhomyces tanzawaensis NRRL Y-17324]